MILPRSNSARPEPLCRGQRTRAANYARTAFRAPFASGPAVNRSSVEGHVIPAQLVPAKAGSGNPPALGPRLRGGGEGGGFHSPGCATGPWPLSMTGRRVTWASNLLMGLPRSTFCFLPSAFCFEIDCHSERSEESRPDRSAAMRRYRARFLASLSRKSRHSREGGNPPGVAPRFRGDDGIYDFHPYGWAAGPCTLRMTCWASFHSGSKAPPFRYSGPSAARY